MFFETLHDENTLTSRRAENLSRTKDDKVRDDISNYYLSMLGRIIPATDPCLRSLLSKYGNSKLDNYCKDINYFSSFSFEVNDAEGSHRVELSIKQVLEIYRNVFDKYYMEEVPHASDIDSHLLKKKQQQVEDEFNIYARRLKAKRKSQK